METVNEKKKYPDYHRKKRNLITIQLRNKDLLEIKKLQVHANAPTGYKRSATIRALVRLGLWVHTLGPDALAAPELRDLSVF
jgi:hypothetical protein